jgi:hypothetical protein
MGALFPVTRRSSPGTVPRLLAKSGSSSHEHFLPFRVRRCVSPARHECRTPSMGFRSPFATSVCEVHISTAVPPAIFVPPSAFLTLSTGYSFSHVVGLFHPTATSGIRSSRVFPAAKPPRLIDEPFPHAVSRVSPPSELPHWCQILSLRFQGLDPGSDPLRSASGLDLPITRSPPEVSTPSGFPSYTWGTSSRPLRS